MNQTFKRFLANASVMYVNEAFLSVAMILVTIKVVAYLGPEKYGIYATVLAFSYFFRLLTESSGIDDLVISDLATNDSSRENLNAYITTGFFLRLFLGMTALALSVTIAHFLHYDRLTFGLIVLFSLSMPFSFHRRKNPFIIRHVIGEKRFLPETIIFAVTSIVLGAKLLMTTMGASLQAFVLADLFLVLGLSGAFLLVASVRGDFQIRMRSFKWRLAGDLFFRSLPISVSGLFVMIFMRIDQVMLSKMVGMEAVGIYSVAVLLTEGTNVVIVVATGLLLPVFARMRDSEKMPGLLSLCFRGATWGSLIIVLIYSRFGEDILRFIWGDQFIASFPPLRILAWNMVFMWISGLHGPAVISKGLQRYTPLLVIIPSIANVILNLILIPTYGAVGAAWATLLCYLSGFTAASFIPPLRSIIIPTWKEMLPQSLFVALLTIKLPGIPALSTGTVFLVFGIGTVFLFLWSMKQVRMLVAQESTA